MRYAIYFSPAEEHPLTKAASAWLGRDAFTGKVLPLVDAGGLAPDDIAALTEEPRRYGFHATLKAPFELAEGQNEERLVTALSHFAAATDAFDIPNVVIGAIGPFFALVPDAAYAELQDFAARVVEAFDPFRAPLSEADIARRKPETLSESRLRNLHRWGYPHVMEDFRFHMTLTGPVPAAKAAPVQQDLERRFSGFTHAPLRVDALTLFVEPQRGEAFTVHSRFALAGAAEPKEI